MVEVDHRKCAVAKAHSSWKVSWIKRFTTLCYRRKNFVKGHYMVVVIYSSRIANETIGAGGEDVVEPIGENPGTLQLHCIGLVIENFTVIQTRNHEDIQKWLC